jgi:hypothetical protein
MNVFLSYRADDSVHATSAIYDALVVHFGRSSVFRDRDSMGLGTLYPGQIRDALQRCDVLLAVIGPHWLDARDAAGRRRIKQPDDWVRRELRTAFERPIRVAPLLLDDVALPSRWQLPHDIRRLSLSNFWRIRNETFASDVAALIAQLDPTAAPTRRNAAAGAGQVNNVTGGGSLYAVQHGSQTININSDGNHP